MAERDYACQEEEKKKKKMLPFLFKTSSEYM